MAGSDLSVKLRLLLSDEGVAQRIGRAAASIAGLRQEFDRLGGSARSSTRAMREGMDSISRQLSRIQTAAVAFAGLFQGAGFFGGIARTAADFESLEAAMKAVFGTAEAAAAEMRRLQAESERLGVPLETLARSWLGFAAAARGTAIEGQQAREVFTSLTEASTVLGLSQAQLEGALMAVQQMISKGTVSSEELRQQLGERLYGAMQIAARSIGVTTEAFGDLLERGMIPAEKFLPAFAAQLRKEFAGGVTDASNTARAAFARLENAWLQLKLEFAKSGFMDALVDSAKQLTAAFQDAGFRQSVREFGALIGNLTRFVVEHGDKLVVLGGVIAGARTGAAAGRLLGPKGAVAGAGIGAVAGGLSAGSLLPEGTASGQDERRVQDVEAAVERLRKRIEETRRASVAGLIKPEEVKARIAQDEATIARLTAKPENAAPGAPSDFGRELMRKQWDAYLKQYRDKAQQLKDALAELREKAKAAGISEASEEFKRAEAAIRAKFAGEKKDDTSTARLAVAKDAADAELAVLKDGLQRQKTALDAALEDRLVSIRGYYAQKTRIEQAEIDAEIGRTRSLLAEQQRIATGVKSESERIRAKGEVARLEAELITLNNRRADIEQANARASAKAERELAEALEEARLKLAEMTGTATDADRRAAIERSYADLKRRLVAENMDTGIVDRLIDVEAAQRNLQALEADWNLALTRMRNAQDAAKIAFEAGLITQSEFQARIAQSSTEAASALDALLPKMESAAQTIGSPESLARIQAWKNELATTQTVVDPIAQSINTSVKDAFEQMFVSIGQGAKSAKGAFLDFARSVVGALQRIAAQKLAEQIFGSFGKGGGGIGGFISGIFKFASGGPVPGTGTGDTVPAMLTPGEYVIRRDVVSRYGRAFFDAINGLRLPPGVVAGRLAFAAGGMVPAVAAPQASQAVRIVNVVDPAMAADWLNSSAGERTILNILQRNAGTVRQMVV